ncbi:MAG: hydrogenase, partial [Pyrinomonadaceae bacterium]|nr:hydrogenase [Pyrinomonadaceae bacterium]
MSKVDEPHDDEGMHLTAPVIEPGHTFASVTDKISSLALKRRTPLGWFIGFAISFALAQVLLLTIAYLVTTGIG